MDVGRYIDGEGDLYEIARAEDTQVGRALLKAARKYEDEVAALYKAQPRIGTEDVRKDVRYLFGEEFGAGFLARLILAAKDRRAKQEERK